MVATARRVLPHQVVAAPDGSPGYHVLRNVRSGFWIEEGTGMRATRRDLLAGGLALAMTATSRHAAAAKPAIAVHKSPT
jgi:hypothetical protein